jgi:hypothetical protein
MPVGSIKNDRIKIASPRYKRAPGFGGFKKLIVWFSFMMAVMMFVTRDA